MNLICPHCSVHDKENFTDNKEILLRVKMGLGHVDPATGRQSYQRYRECLKCKRRYKTEERILYEVKKHRNWNGEK